jgi:hypothetical protein
MDWLNGSTVGRKGGAFGSTPSVWREREGHETQLTTTRMKPVNRPLERNPARNLHDTIVESSASSQPVAASWMGIKTAGTRCRPLMIAWLTVGWDHACAPSPTTDIPTLR